MSSASNRSLEQPAGPTRSGRRRTRPARSEVEGPVECADIMLSSIHPRSRTLSATHSASIGSADDFEVDSLPERCLCVACAQQSRLQQRLAGLDLNLGAE